MSRYNGYHDRGEFVSKSNQQLLERNNNQIMKQDEKLTELVDVTKKSKRTARALGQNLESQNIKLENLGMEIEIAEKQMIGTIAKFENFIGNSSFCCLYAIILILLICLTFVIVFL